MRIRCLTGSTWKVRNGESASEVNRSSGDAQVVSHHRYLVVFHPFVEQLTVFYTSELVLLGPRSPSHRAIRDGILTTIPKCVSKLESDWLG